MLLPAATCMFSALPMPCTGQEEQQRKDRTPRYSLCRVLRVLLSCQCDVVDLSFLNPGQTLTLVLEEQPSRRDRNVTGESPGLVTLQIDRGEIMDEGRQYWDATEQLK